MTEETKLTDFERAHAESILDENPTLSPLPGEKPIKILVGSVLRKPAKVLQAFLDALAWQTFRPDGKVQLEYYLIDNGLDQEAKKVLHAFKKAYPELVRLDHAPLPEAEDYAESDGATRKWSPSAWHRVAALKNKIFACALQEKFDFVWQIDADVICDPTTLQSLLDAGTPIVAGVYWTHWQRAVDEDGFNTVHAGPQVWVTHPYEMHGNVGGKIYKTPAEFRTALISRELCRVGGLGACTLFHTSVVSQVNFSKAGNLPDGPMSDGEDRHLCWRANALHVPMFADAWPDIYHAYHPQDYDTELPKWVERLKKREFPEGSPGPLDLVSVVVAPLDWPGELQRVRGRLIELPLAPELVEKLASMKVGSQRVVQVHFPQHFWHAGLAGRTGTVQISLLDWKPYAMAPVIDEELFVGELTGKWIDAVSMTPEQVAEIAGEAYVE